ncbi:hypothetical protein SNOUR_18010 [Streptomyces noursei ATCC 11455]|uniref:Ig-like domain-containing protein n=1 Tax=Streptomyces noursei TaxID=1971 RepID=UPI00081CF5F8|nr:hypothetical protein SNOUR_18010 [Streptomyces noursei ATCC 11455]
MVQTRGIVRQRAAGWVGEGRPPRRRGRGLRGGRRLGGDDAVRARPGTPVTVDVLADDTDGAYSSARGLTVSGLDAPADGTAAVPDGTVAHTPDSGFSGCDSFAHAVADSRGLTATAAAFVVTPAKWPAPQGK